MKYKFQTILDTRGGENLKTIQGRIDDSKLIKLYAMLENIYRNPIGSIVREYTSNAHDANKEATNFKDLNWEEICKKYSWITDEESGLSMTEEEFYELKDSLIRCGEDEPIIMGVSQYKDSMDYYFYVKDYGIGLSPSRMEHIFFSYLSSTKEDTDDEIGGFGIGAKSALAYTHTFFIDTVYCGVKYKYIMTKDSKGLPVGKLLASYDTTEDNGTIIRVNIKTRSDSLTFRHEISKKLSYFPNIYYEPDPFKQGNGIISSFNDNHELVISDHWIYSAIASGQYSDIHICLDNIPYTIDWNELGISAISFPIALRFNTGEVLPTPSRESLLYSKETKQRILDKIEFVRDYFIEKLNIKHQDTDDYVYSLQTVQEESNKYYITDEKWVDLYYLFKDTPIDAKSFYSEYIPFKEVGLSMKECRYYTLPIKEIGSINTIYATNKSYYDGGYYSLTLSSIIDRMQTHTSFITRKSVMHKRRTAYLSEENNLPPVCPLVKLFPFGLKEYKSSYRLRKVNKGLWRKQINAVNKILDDYVKSCIDYDVPVNPNWVKKYNAGLSKFSPKKTAVISQNILAHEYTGLNNYTYKIYLEEKLYKRTYNNYYFTKEHSDLGLVIKDALRGKFGTGVGIDQRFSSKFRFYLLSKKNIKIIDSLNMDNWYKIDDSFEFKHACFKESVTYKMAKRCFDNAKSIKDSYLKNISFYLSEESKSLSKFKDYIHFDKMYSDVIIDYCKKRGLIDYEAVSKAKRLSYIHDVVLSPYILDQRTSISPEMAYFIASLLIKQRVRVNDEYYSSRLTFLLSKMLKDDKLYSTSHYKPFETSLWEDYYENLKDKKNETKKWGFAKNV